MPDDDRADPWTAVELAHEVLGAALYAKAVRAELLTMAEVSA